MIKQGSDVMVKKQNARITNGKLGQGFTDFPNSRRHRKTLGPGKVAYSKLYVDNPDVLKATVRNFVYFQIRVFFFLVKETTVTPNYI